MAALALGAATLTGCISTYSNMNRFASSPHIGMGEAELIQKYGAPDYVYRVRDNKFLLGVGQYAGYDLVITTKGGVVRSTHSVLRGQSVTFLHPAPWMGMD
jgi:hypothetical protein